MEVISKVSKGSRMDQIYIPKNRAGLSIGSYVIIKQLDTKKQIEKLVYYNITELEPIKIEVVKQIIRIIDGSIENENIIITGSFLDKGFKFNDIDIVIISGKKTNEKEIEKEIENSLKIKTHIISLSAITLMQGLSTDPLYQLMLTRCVAKKRFIYHAERKINYKLLDLHLLKSKTLIENFDVLKGSEKYYLVRNLIAIDLFIHNQNLTKERVDSEIRKVLNLKRIDEIKENMLNKTVFLKKYKELYKNIFDKIMYGIKNGTKQKKTR